MIVPANFEAVIYKAQCATECLTTRSPVAYYAWLSESSICFENTQTGFACDFNSTCIEFSASVALCALTDQACQCSVVSEYGPACSACYATVAPEDASAYAALLTGCGGCVGGGSGATTTTDNSATTGGNAQATAGTAATNAKAESTGWPNTSKRTSSASHGGLLGASAVFWISIVVFMGVTHHILAPHLKPGD
jgi:hypothetical protein